MDGKVTRTVSGLLKTDKSPLFSDKSPLKIREIKVHLFSNPVSSRLCPFNVVFVCLFVVVVVVVVFLFFFAVSF